MFVYHHEHEADGHEDVCDGHHRLIGRDGQRHGRRRVRHHDDGEQEDEERLRRRLQSWTANQNKASDVNTFHIRRSCDAAAWLTDHEVRHAAEDDGGDGAQREDVRQDLRQEVHRQSVVATDVLVPEGTTGHMTYYQNHCR